MSDLNGFRAYESAIIGGMLASGKHTADSVREQFSEIRRTARLFSGGVSDTYYPIGAAWQETHTACIYLHAMLDKPLPLAEVVERLKAAGYSDDVARYAYRAALSHNINSVFDAELEVIDDVPMLSKRGAKL